MGDAVNLCDFFTQSKFFTGFFKTRLKKFYTCFITLSCLKGLVGRIEKNQRQSLVRLESKKEIGNFVSKNLSNCNVMTFKAMPESQTLNVQMGGSDNWGIPEAYKLRDIVTLSFLEKSKVMSSTFSHTVSLDSIHIQLLQCSGQ